MAEVPHQPRHTADLARRRSVSGTGRAAGAHWAICAGGRRRAAGRVPPSSKRRSTLPYRRPRRGWKPIARASTRPRAVHPGAAGHGPLDMKRPCANVRWWNRQSSSEGWAGPSCGASSRSTVGNASRCSTTSTAPNSSRGTATGARRPGTRTVTANTPSRPRCTRSSTTSTPAGSRSVRSPADGWLASVSSCHTFGPGSRSWHSSTSAHHCVRRVSAAVCPSSSSRSPAPPATPTWSSRRRHRKTPCGSTSVAASSPWRNRWPSYRDVVHGSRHPERQVIQGIIAGQV
jgi:hypothetical protein